MIVRITPDWAVKMWPTVEPLLAPAVAETLGCFETPDILRDILNGNVQLWTAADPDTKSICAAMTTQIHTYPRRKSLRVEFIGGTRLHFWAKDFCAVLDDFARENGITLMEGAFRRGWVRMWPGSREHGVSLVKELV